MEGWGSEALGSGASVFPAEITSIVKATSIKRTAKIQGILLKMRHCKKITLQSITQLRTL